MSSEYYEYIRASLPTAAVYQKENAALAIRALEVLGRTCLLYTSRNGMLPYATGSVKTTSESLSE